MSAEKIAILAGGKHLPYRLAKHCNPDLIIGFKGQAIPSLYEKYKYEEVSLGEVGKLLKLLEKNDIKKICMLGKLERPRFKDLSLDMKAVTLAAKYRLDKVLQSEGDDGLLRLVKRILEDHGVDVVGAHKLCPALLLPVGSFTKVKPSKSDIQFIKRGFDVAHALGAVDVGQAVVIEEGVVLGVEAAEGTDELIKRCMPLSRGKGPILVKALKPDQDLDIDMPVFGLDTLRLMKEGGYKGFAGLAAKTLMADDQDEVLSYADQHKMFIHGS